MPLDSERRDLMTWWPRSSEPTAGSLVDSYDWVCVGGEDEEPAVFLALAKDESGRIVCVGLILGDLAPWSHRPPREINAALLRGIRLPQLITAAIRSGEVPDEFGELVRGILDEAPSAGRSQRPGPSGYDDEHFREVANAYRAALVEAPGAPTKWLAEHLVVSLPTARRWVQRARDRGFLGPSAPGRAGEHPDPKETS